MSQESGKPYVAVIVPVHNRRETTRRFLRQFMRIDCRLAEMDLIIIDDGSTDGTAEMVVQECPEAILLKGSGELWWTGAVAKGIDFVREREYDHVLLMNDDIQFDRQAVATLLAARASHPRALLAALKLRRRSDGVEQIYTAGFRLSGWLRELKAVLENESIPEGLPDVIPCDALSGSCLLIPMDVVQAVGNFDTARFPHHHGDLEFTLRAKLAGFACLTVTASCIYTEQNQSYPRQYLVRSTRGSYLRNLFDDRKYYYGFRALRSSCFMHRGLFRGAVLYARRILGLVRDIFAKMVLPNAWLRVLYLYGEAD